MNDNQFYDKEFFSFEGKFSLKNSDIWYFLDEPLMGVLEKEDKKYHFRLIYDQNNIFEWIIIPKETYESIFGNNKLVEYNLYKNGISDINKTNDCFYVIENKKKDTIEVWSLKDIKWRTE